MKYKTGVSGNPNGRPKGTGARQQLFNNLVAPRQKELVEKAIELAIAGNEPMLRLLLERILPAKPIDEPIEPIELDENSLTQQGKKVLSLIANGEVSLSQGAALLHTITSQAKLIETDELVKRVETLEKIHN